MAITGTLTARQYITQALRKVGVVGREFQPDGEMINDGLIALNAMLKHWQNHGPHLWGTTTGSVTLVADTASYALSPRPIAVLNARFKNASGTELQMFRLTRQEYDELPMKTTNGVPTQFMVQKGITTTTMYVWPLPASVTTETVEYTYTAEFEDVTDSDDLPVPSEFRETVIYNLAARFADDYSLNDDVSRRVIARAQSLLIDAEAFDRETVYFEMECA